MKQKPTHEPITNEADNGLRNRRGAIAMARTNDLHSATAQFFINLVDNGFLDHRPGNYGYAVFGRVAGGMDVIRKYRRGQDRAPWRTRRRAARTGRHQARPARQRRLTAGPAMKRRLLAGAGGAFGGGRVVLGRPALHPGGRDVPLGCRCRLPPS